MDTRRLNRLLLLVALITPGLKAQLPVGPQTPPAREESSDDPFGRSTPRGTVLGFMRATEGEDYDRAVIYMDTKQHGNLARELAKQLQTILNRQASVDLSKLSTQPEGDLLNSENPNRDLVGVAKTSTRSVELWVERVQRGDNPPVWLFSRDTLRHVPEIYEDIGSAPELVRYLPKWLNARVFSRPLWLWSMALISIPLVLMLGSLFGRLLRPLLAAVAKWFRVSAEIDSVQGLVGPLRLVLFGILLLIGSGYSYTLLGRHFASVFGNVLIVFGAAWLLMRVLGIARDLYLGRLRKTHALGKIALAGLLGRMLQIAVLIIGILTVLYLAGINLTAALTGLGIGGLALAFAAQKTLENLFGGIMIISDRPVRIGDSCKIGDIIGTVVDIGLRSTQIRTIDRTIVTIPNGQLATMNLENFTVRDKFLFHRTISLSHETTVDQMETILGRFRDLLDKHPHVESNTARVRFIDIKSASQDVEIFAYIFAADYDEFLAIQERLLLQLLGIVESVSATLAVPLQRTYLVRDSVSSKGEQKVKTAGTS
ncbi:MAG TPA: mechanosensitive ion channel family protein [Candidatus Acidoferrales bacterium]|nr:mechanosensitive ion channel family protein [Candidatus Acidoferrales bacterium]